MSGTGVPQPDSGEHPDSDSTGSGASADIGEHAQHAQAKAGTASGEPVDGAPEVPRELRQERPARGGVGHGRGTTVKRRPNGLSDSETGEPVPPSDAELMEAMRGGDKEVYGELYRRHVAAARRLAHRYAHDPHDADDLVSAAFADTLQAIKRGAGPTVDFRFYLLACVRRNGGRYATQRWTVPLDESPELATPALDIPGLAVGGDNDVDRVIAWQAFRALPTRYQTALWHALVEDEPMAEVGVHLGLGANAAVAVVHRAKEALRISFLSAMLAAPRPEGACTVAGDQLADLVRKGVTRRTRALSEHVLDCTDCQRRLLEIEPVEQAMKILVGPAVLGISVASYLGRARGAVWLKVGGMAAGVAAIVAVLLLVRPGAVPADAEVDTSVAFPPATAGASGSGVSGSGEAASSGTSGQAGAALDDVTADPAAVPDAVTPAAQSTHLAQGVVPRLYPGDGGWLHLTVEPPVAGASLVVAVPAQLSVREAELSPSCMLQASGTVVCGPLAAATVGVDIPFQLSPAVELGGPALEAEAWLESAGQRVSGQVPLTVEIHGDPCCEPS